MEKNYYLGLDIGTNSCGWAVSDEDYNLLKAKGNKLWGVRLFDPANSAEERRLKRASRRNLVRRKLKLDWLKEIFKPEIDKVDKNMLDRINYSNLWEEDKLYFNKNLKSKDSLFFGEIDGKKYTDKNYFDEYPTIYHLRKELLSKPAKDVRHLYLAVHNIIKRRGHFLYEGSFFDNDRLLFLLADLIEFIGSMDYESIEMINLKKPNEEVESSIMNILLKNAGIRQTKLEFNSIFEAKNKAEKAIIASFVDGKINLKDVLKKDTETELKLNFNDEDFESKLDQIKGELDDDELIFISKLNVIFSTILLKKILGNNNYLCESMVDIFDEHKRQLKFFKQFIKDYYKKEYFKIFRDAQDKTKKSQEKFVNYVLYVNGDIYNGHKRVIGLNESSRDKESFYKFVKTILSKPTQNQEYDENDYESRKLQILEWIENDVFLRKQRTKANAVFPNKLYERELKKILEVSAQKYEFLNNVDELGISNKDKILKILTFRVPYFVGPIGNSENGWAKRDKTIDYKPWNFEKMINLDDAEDAFIANMTNKCTYLKTEDVLPMQSILYSAFRVLNEINNLTIDGNKITVPLKQQIFIELFARRQKVSVKMLKDFLVANNYFSNEEIKEISIGGIDKEFANNFASFSRLAMSHNFALKFVRDNIDVFEKVIKYHTIISDKTRLEKRIKREFSEILNDAQIKELKGLNFQGWGRLSQKFLQGLYFVNKITGEKTNIIGEMWNTNQNLQEILFNSSYTLAEELEKYSEQKKDDIVYNDVQELYCSPAVKRSVWQAIKIIKELKNTLGGFPSKIFVEVTRDDDQKGEQGRKLSRKNNLLKLYESKDFLVTIKKLSIDIEELMNELNKIDNTTLRSEKLYLYFLQLGRCAYSGEKINIEDIANEHLYDVDHIIPQSKLKDDSINNKVLVKTEYNLAKLDTYPIFTIHPEWVEKQKSFWKMLVKLELMSKEKYNRLVRTNDLSEDELAGFIARQLVETSQSAKAVIDLLKTMIPQNCKIVYSKARFVSEFRNKFDIYKSRIVNDLHHCKDAYLNIVVGNVLNSRFTDDPRNFYKVKNKNSRLTRNIKKLFNDDSIIYASNSDKIVWNGKTDIKKVKDVCLKNDCLVTQMSYTKLNGMYYDETRYKSKKNNPAQNELFELKGDKNNPLSNTERYGGYNKLKIAYYMLVESERKGEKIKTIEAVPIIIYQRYKNDEDINVKILEYLSKESKLVNAKILIERINIKSVLKIDSGYYLLAGKTGDSFILHNANQWNISNEDILYVKALEKYAELKAKKSDGHLVEIENKVVLSKPSKQNNTEIALFRDKNIELFNLIINQLSKPIYAGMALGTTLKSKLQQYKDDFVNATVITQAQMLNGILLGISTGAASADLSLFGDGKIIGKIILSKNITGKNIKLIKESSTGLYYQEERL